MSSATTEPTESTDPRDRRAVWPWGVLALFLAVAGAAMLLVAINHESIAEQIPYVIAFTMFGVVGALIVSHDRWNTIGFLFLWATFMTATSFLAGEVLTYAVGRGLDAWWVVLCGFLNNAGWLFGILLTLFLLPLLFPDGHLPSRRWRPLLWLIVIFQAVIAMSLLFGQETLSGSGDAVIANPLYVDAIGRLPSLDPVDRRSCCRPSSGHRSSR